MSADNWNICPRCVSDAEAAVARATVDVAAAYGTVPVEEFDLLRAAIPVVNEEDYRTFREDYGFYVAEGVVVAEYAGLCSRCGLSAGLHATEKFWPAGEEEASDRG